MMTGRDHASARIAIMQLWQHPYHPISAELAKKLLEELAMDDAEYEAAYAAGESSGYADWIFAFDRIGMEVDGPTDACEQVERERQRRRADEVELSIWRHNAEHQATEPRLTQAQVDDLVRYFVAAEEKARAFG